MYKVSISIALILSIVASAAYACSCGVGPAYPFCREIAFIGVPGILAAAMFTIAGLGSHGGGPLTVLLAVATPLNFLLYLGVCAAAQRLANTIRSKQQP